MINEYIQPCFLSSLYSLKWILSSPKKNNSVRKGLKNGVSKTLKINKKKVGEEWHEKGEREALSLPSTDLNLFPCLTTNFGIVFDLQLSEDLNGFDIQDNSLQGQQQTG